MSTTRALSVPVWAILLVFGLTVHARAQTLAEAARTADWDAVHAMLDRGADPSIALGDGSTALHWAGYWDSVEVVDALIDAGADVDAVTDLGVTPLWTSSETGSVSTVTRLLQAGADPNAVLPSGETLVMTASRSGNPDVVRLLVVHGADVNGRGARGQTALMWAVAQQHADVVELLLSHGADLHARSEVRLEVVKTTPEPWNPEYVVDLKQGGFTPLLFAARVGDVASAEYLVRAGAEVDDTSPSGTSATVVAAHSGHGELAAFLLEHGADPNAADAGYTALHAAILYKDEALVKALLAHGADPNAVVRASTPVRRDAIDFYIHPSYVGATPFWLAARFSVPGIMRQLVDHGADPRFVHRPTYWPGSLSVRDGRSQVQEGDTTAAMAAVGMGGRSPLVAVDRLDRIAEMAPVRSTRREPDPMQLETLALEAVTIAVEHGTDIHITNAAGNSALHGAAARGFDTVVRYLVDRGARLDLTNNDGQTPREWAISQRAPLRTVELLQRLSAGE